MKKISGIVLVCLALCGILYAVKRPEDMTREEKNKLLVESAITAINDRDWEFMAKLYSPSFVQHGVGPGGKETTSWTDFELGCRVIHNKLPTLQAVIEDSIAEGDKVAIRLKSVVTYMDERWRGKKTQKTIEFSEIDIFRIAGGRIVEEWCEADTRDWEKKLRNLQYVKTWH